MDMEAEGKTLGLEGRTSPSYMKVRKWLVDYIEREKLEPGDRIPSERILANSLGLSRPTVARAVSELVQDGVLMREQRSGTFVGNRGILRQRSGIHNIGIVMPWVIQDGFGQITARVEKDPVRIPFWRESMNLEIMHGVLSVLNEQNCRFEICPNNSQRDEAELIRRLKDEDLDGVLAIPLDSTQNQAVYSELVERGKPLVFIDRYCPGVRADRVVTDNFNGARDAVRYLANKGHKRIGFFTDFGKVTSAQDRWAGYRAGLEEAGIPYDESIVCGPHIVRFGWWRLDYALEHCRSLPDPITAVFCMNDSSILATLDAADKMDITIPRDLEVVGFFDDHFASDIHTPFTRMIQSTTEMGRAAAEFLMERIKDKAPGEPRTLLLPAKLVEA